MKKMWAPWRMSYISQIGKKKDKGCVFCSIVSSDEDRKNLILCRSEKAYVVMNRYPYNNGHLLIIPYKHTSDILELDEDESSDMWKLIGKCKEALQKLYKPDGYNIGMNLGQAAGAGVDKHIHMHILPRWTGDTNYVPVLGETKVISQGLEETYNGLLPFFE